MNDFFELKFNHFVLLLCWAKKIVMLSQYFITARVGFSVHFNYVSIQHKVRLEIVN